MQKKCAVWVGIFLLVILGACASPSSPTSTPSQQNAPEQSQSITPMETQVEVADPVWTASLSGAVNAAPLVSGDLVIVPTADGVIHAVQAETGEIAWVYSGEAKVWDASVSVDETKVCAGVEGRKVICLDAKTGSPLWTAALELEVQSRLALTPDRIFAPTTLAGPGLETDFNGQASLIALDALNGNIIWQSPTENYILRRPVVNGNLVITGGAYQLKDKPAGEVATRVYAFNINDGSMLWQHQSNDGLLRWVESNADVVVFSAATEILYALNLNDGQLLWQAGPGYWMQFPVMYNGQIFFGSGDEIFHAYNASTGQETWSHEISLSALNQIGRPILQGDTIWFNSVTGEIYALNLSNGERLITVTTGQSSRVGGALYGSLYIMGDPDGKLYAYDIQ